MQESSFGRFRQNEMGPGAIGERVVIGFWLVVDTPHHKTPSKCNLILKYNLILSSFNATNLPEMEHKQFSMNFGITPVFSPIFHVSPVF